jgi:hypothetical protein
MPVSGKRTHPGSSSQFLFIIKYHSLTDYDSTNKRLKRDEFSACIAGHEYCRVTAVSRKVSVK